MVDGEIDGPERLRCSTNLLMSVKERTHLSQRCERYCRGDNVFGFGGEAVVAAQGACELSELRERQLAGELRRHIAGETVASLGAIPHTVPLVAELAIDVGNAAQDAAALGWRPDGNVKRFGEEASSIQPEINVLRRNADGAPSWT